MFSKADVRQDSFH